MLNVLLEKLRRLGILRRRSHVEQDQVGGINGNPFPQDVDDPALGDLSLESVEKLLPFDLAGIKLKFRHLLRLGSI